eukprot:521685-Prorocentrum_minimum.AAC.1
MCPPLPAQGVAQGTCLHFAGGVRGAGKYALLHLHRDVNNSSSPRAMIGPISTYCLLNLGVTCTAPRPRPCSQSERDPRPL